jgi:hypothetical protein
VYTIGGANIIPNVEMKILAVNMNLAQLARKIIPIFAVIPISPTIEKTITVRLKSFSSCVDAY